MVPIPAKLVGEKPTTDKSVYDGFATRMIQRQYYTDLLWKMPYEIKLMFILESKETIYLRHEQASFGDMIFSSSDLFMWSVIYHGIKHAQDMSADIIILRTVVFK